MISAQEFTRKCIKAKCQFCQKEKDVIKHTTATIIDDVLYWKEYIICWECLPSLTKYKEK